MPKTHKLITSPIDALTFAEIVKADIGFYAVSCIDSPVPMMSFPVWFDDLKAVSLECFDSPVMMEMPHIDFEVPTATYISGFEPYSCQAFKNELLDDLREFTMHQRWEFHSLEVWWAEFREWVGVGTPTEGLAYGPRYELIC